MAERIIDVPPKLLGTQEAVLLIDLVQTTNGLHNSFLEITVLLELWVLWECEGLTKSVSALEPPVFCVRWPRSAAWMGQCCSHLIYLPSTQDRGTFTVFQCTLGSPRPYPSVHTFCQLDLQGIGFWSLGARRGTKPLPIRLERSAMRTKPLPIELKIAV